MRPITIEAEVGRDHRLVNALPPEVPVGRVKLIIELTEEQPINLQQGQTLTREEARRRWQSAGKMLKESLVPAGFVRSDETEDRRLSALFGQGPSSDVLIDEDRGPRE